MNNDTQMIYFQQQPAPTKRASQEEAWTLYKSLLPRLEMRRNVNCAFNIHSRMNLQLANGTNYLQSVWTVFMKGLRAPLAVGISSDTP